MTISSTKLFTLYADVFLETRRQIRLPTHSGIAGRCSPRAGRENITDPCADQGFNQAVDRRTGFTTRSILCVPINNKAGARMGVAQALNKRGGVFTAKDEARLKAFAAQVAVSLENAKLFDDVLNMKNYNESILKSTSNGIVTTGRRRSRHRHRQRGGRRPCLASRESELIGNCAGEVVHRPQLLDRRQPRQDLQATGETALAIERGGGAGRWRPLSTVNLTAIAPDRRDRGADRLDDRPGGRHRGEARPLHHVALHVQGKSRTGASSPGGRTSRWRGA